VESEILNDKKPHTKSRRASCPNAGRSKSPLDRSNSSDFPAPPNAVVQNEIHRTTSPLPPPPYRLRSTSSIVFNLTHQPSARFPLPPTPVRWPSLIFCPSDLPCVYDMSSFPEELPPLPPPGVSTLTSPTRLARLATAIPNDSVITRGVWAVVKDQCRKRHSLEPLYRFLEAVLSVTPPSPIP